MRNSIHSVAHSLLTKAMFLALAIAIFTCDGATATVAQTSQVTVEVNETKMIFKPSRQVKRYDEIVADEDQVVSATREPDNEAVKIKGLKEGRSKVTFSGVYRRVVVGNRVREEEIPFSGSVLVVVRPARPLIRPAIKNYFVEPHDNKRTDIEYFLGAQFARQGEWRGVTATLQPFNSSVARVQLDLSGSPKITITGEDAGRVTILLSGEQRLQNSWQKVSRSIEIYVPKRDSNSIASENPSEDINADATGAPIETINALESTYDSNKFLADNARSEEEKRRAVGELKKLAALIKLTLERERNSTQPRPAVLSRLSALLDKTLAEIKNLETPTSEVPTVEVSKLGSFAGMWSLYRDGNKVRDGYRIAQTETNVGTRLDVSNSQSQQWFFVVLKGEIFMGYEFQNELGVGTNLLQLRPRSRIQLDIWKQMKLTDEKLEFTRYYLLRDSR